MGISVTSSLFYEFLDVQSLERTAMLAPEFQECVDCCFPFCLKFAVGRLEHGHGLPVTGNGDAFAQLNFVEQSSEMRLRFVHANSLHETSLVWSDQIVHFRISGPR